MALRLGDEAPNFTADTTDGKITFHEWLGNGWGILFSHPKDFTPVCTTELGYMARITPDFKKRNVKVIAISVDPLESHKGWIGDINETQNCTVSYPLIADPEKKVAMLYDMIHPNALDNMTVRSVFVIGPDKKIKLMLTYPASCGRNQTGKSKVAAYCSARSSNCVSASGASACENATQPASVSSAISVRCEPLRPSVSAPIG